MLGMPLTPVAITTWRGRMERVAPSRRKRDGPALLFLVVAAAQEFRAGPVVELHALDVGLEPVGELVLRNVGRPVRRERHVRQVIDLHLIVQRQRVVAVAPVVADARLAVDDQRVDLQLRQPRRDRQPRLPAADHQHVRVAVRIGLRRLAQVEPVRPAEIARIALPGRARAADGLLVALQFVERGEQGPGLHALARGDEPHHAAAAPLRGLETEDRLDRRCAGAGDLAGRRAVRREREAGGAGARRRALSAAAIASPPWIVWMSQVKASTSRQ